MATNGAGRLRRCRYVRLTAIAIQVICHISSGDACATRIECVLMITVKSRAAIFATVQYYTSCRLSYLSIYYMVFITFKVI